ncbi:MAG: hypothetical protein RIR01_2357 [Bacteroidota bacterium]|jgi:hypothetical protein
MKKFILTSTHYIDENGFINLSLRPSDPEIEDFIASNCSLENKSDVDSQIAQRIELMTPILFEKFNQLESVSSEIKNLYEL